MPSPVYIWLWAIRPRTLPLAGSAIILGCGLAALHAPLNLPVAGLALLTAILLQILSNLANDYGDAVAGADTAKRLGPQRMVGSGLATPTQMYLAITLAVLLTISSGLALLYVATWGNWLLLSIFIGLGLACIIAAIAYTMGKKPYGYYGWGDLAAGIFFGPVAVLGTIALCSGSLDIAFWLPGCAAGLCSTAVLNINNMRDRMEDLQSGKLTIAARLGVRKAQYYHASLIGLCMILWCIFWELKQPEHLSSFLLQSLTLILAIPLLRSTWLAITHTDAECLNQQLKHTVLGSALLHTGLGLICIC